MQPFSIFSRRAAVAGTVLAAFALAGCHGDNQTAPPIVVSPNPAPVVTTMPQAAPPGNVTTTTSPDTKINTNAGPGASTGTDTALADAVNTAIVHNKQMTGSRVEPVATAGVVTLTGQVQNQQQKALAEKTATQVSGVASVKNKLIIVSTGGAKPKPQVITKTKTIIIHDQAPASPLTPDPAETPAPPATPDTSSPPTTGTGQ